MTEKKKSSLLRVRGWLLKALRRNNADPLIEAADILYFAGLILAAAGAYQYEPRLGLIVTGALLLLTVRPLWHWIK